METTPVARDCPPNYQSFLICDGHHCTTIKLDNPSVAKVSFESLLLKVSIVIEAILTGVILFLGTSELTFIVGLFSLLILSFQFSYCLDQLSNCSHVAKLSWVVYSTGNIPETVFTLTALKHRHFDLVIESCLGSVFSNTILLGGILYCSGIASADSDKNLLSPNTHKICSSLGVPLGITILGQVCNSQYWYYHLISIFLLMGYLWSSIQGYIVDYFNRTTSAPTEISDTERQNQHNNPLLLFGLITCIVLMSITTEQVLSDLDTSITQLKIPRLIINYLFFPLIANTPELLAGYKINQGGDISSALNVGLGSSIQILWCLLPLGNLVGWACEREFVFNFDKKILIGLGISLPVFVSSLVAIKESSRFTWGLLMAGLWIFQGALLFLPF